jgi:hypothetical protein
VVYLYSVAGIQGDKSGTGHSDGLTLLSSPIKKHRLQAFNLKKLRQETTFDFRSRNNKTTAENSARHFWRRR